MATSISLGLNKWISHKMPFTSCNSNYSIKNAYKLLYLRKSLGNFLASSGKKYLLPSFWKSQISLISLRWISGSASIFTRCLDILLKRLLASRLSCFSLCAVVIALIVVCLKLLLILSLLTKILVRSCLIIFHFYKSLLILLLIFYDSVIKLIYWPKIK